MQKIENLILEQKQKRVRGRFAGCTAGNTSYHFEVGADYPQGKEDTIITAAKNFAKTKNWAVISNVFEKESTIRQGDAEVKVAPGVYIQFQEKTKTA
jgi:hypothetical protein